MHTIAVIGLGYIGLPTAVVFAQKGYRVIGVDIDAKKVEAVNAGRSYVREPYLNEMLRDPVARSAQRNHRRGSRCNNHRT